MKRYLVASAWMAAGVWLLLCPFMVSLYWLRVLTNICMFAILAQAINIIAGYTGYPAFGNIVFFGLGAYSTAICMVKLHLPFALTVPVGVAVCLLFTLVCGMPVLRLRGHYFAIATLGLNEATRAIVDNLTSLTGGGMGLSLPLPPGEVSTNSRMFYYIMCGTMLLALLMTYLISTSRFGYACRAIRADEDAAESIGIQTTATKTMAWMASAALTSVAGSTYAYWMSYIEPAAVFDMMIAVKAFVMFLLGGAGTLLGPIVGALFIELVATLTWSHLLTYHIGALGLIIILVVLCIPQGFVVGLRQGLSLPAFARKRRSTPTIVIPAAGDRSSPAQAAEMLRLHHIDSGYKPLQVLWDIELTLHQGEWLALIGPNGAGKTTLLKTIAGLLQPFQGHMQYLGEEISHLPAHERVRRRIALVPEGRRLFAGMTVYENLMMGAFTRQESSEVATQLAWVLELFPVLKDRANQVVGTLSGGERQMCAIGRGLMSQPSLLLIDELSMGLAPIVVDRLLEALVTINHQGVTLMVVEQDIYTALTYAHRGYVLREGMIAQHGPAKQLLADPNIRTAYFGVR